MVSEQTATQLSQMLEGVTAAGGTATKVVIPGYRVAGKTGTAYRYEDRLADYSGYTTSFIGFAPADDPQFVVAVPVQEVDQDIPVTRRFAVTVMATPTLQGMAPGARQLLE